ncbi:hypothetical protein FHR83_008761 [Actinoplanes campanulatus]|uniref:LmbU n=1 Tax=Actinoplanes campanulatus TaxID=113559 RepID=A0A7W5FJQ2_9ACTN|nr:LmbU family transcriptional regulator [Actinoplanes campanulatus]MBB3101033.1 hypothetical protein [Actinoplanes campanulatus]GGN49324.1 hypothetical protein GCM10010109_87260 [Actinoplanes campanulatus]GID41875.1 hypothetical protein Aca09nite_83810 [Actinoplanes campanulatus]
MGSTANDGKYPRATPEAALSNGRILVTQVGLRIPRGVTFAGWERAGWRLVEVLNSSVWCIGDWLEHGEREFTGRYRGAVETLGLEYQTVRNYAWVARRFPLARRRAALSFQHHAEVAGLPDEQQDRWLDQAEEGGWSRNELRRNLRATRNGGARRLTAPLPRITTEEQRLRWQAAAERTKADFEQWIVQSLDDAADAVLDTRA